MDFKISPIQFTIDIISHKWTIEIIECLRTGRKRYSDLLNSNSQMTSKVLSERLKELYELGIVDKIIINIMPVQAKYELTEKGVLLLPILFELAIFGSLNFAETIFSTNYPNESEIIKHFGNHFNINAEELKILEKRIKNSS